MLAYSQEVQITNQNINQQSKMVFYLGESMFEHLEEKANVSEWLQLLQASLIFAVEAQEKITKKYFTHVDAGPSCNK